MSDENVIQFPGAGDEGQTPPDGPDEGTTAAGTTGTPLGQAFGGQLSADQEKALQVILSGMSFVCIGIKPTDSGADFFTAVEGDARELTDAQPHLDGVITRAFGRKGLL